MSNNAAVIKTPVVALLEFSSGILVEMNENPFKYNGTFNIVLEIFNN
jgi:hypothetical protein